MGGVVNANPLAALMAAAGRQRGGGHGGEGGEGCQPGAGVHSPVIAAPGESHLTMNSA